MQFKRVVKKHIPINETGHTIGEAHHNSKLTDVEVELMRDLYEYFGMGYAKLAWIFTEMSGYKIDKHHVRDIVTYRRRSATQMGTRTVMVKETYEV